MFPIFINYYINKLLCSVKAAISVYLCFCPNLEELLCNKPKATPSLNFQVVLFQKLREELSVLSFEVIVS